ncbi:hypothetical protein JHD49_03780 [Sulfurimonas sp. SAG-AH-194-C21]|nr:hypothetical protein [Sulfurimonas sp. SAG-AH-194-C21]MDF1883051.1 hypothetical protein [Sulfurimonas sp. SAG-AH-194-C21]
MVKKMAKFFAYTLFFAFALVAFSPKSSVYYFGEQELKKFGVVISNESLQESTLSLNIKNLYITLKEIDSAVIKEVDITLLFVYNSIHLEEIELSSLVESYLPSKVDSLDIHYTIFNPLHITAEALGQFGEATINVSIADRNATLSLKPSKKMFASYKKTLKMMKKYENGEYVYAKTF